MNKQEFSDLAASLVPTSTNKPEDNTRLLGVLAACGVRANLPSEVCKPFETDVTCTHCNGTGKVKGVDQELVRAAKKRRFDAVKK